MEELRLNHITLNTCVMSRIVMYLKTANSKLTAIKLCFIKRKSSHNFQQIVNAHASHLEKHDIYIWYYNEELNIVKGAQLQLVIKILDSLGRRIYFNQYGSKIQKYLELLVSEQVLRSTASKMNQTDKRYFQQHCANKLGLNICLNEMKQSCIDYFCNSNCSWINLEFITKLYPNLQNIEVSDVKVENIDKIMHAIMKYSTDIRTTLHTIVIIFSEEKQHSFNLKETLANYEQDLAQLNFAISKMGFGLRIERKGRRKVQDVSECIVM
eukprot:324535_1